MPILMKLKGSNFASKSLEIIPFKDEEKDFQELIKANPLLLQNSGDCPIKVVASKLGLDSGNPDIFCIDSEGLPIIVEAKLVRNEQSKREIVGQLIDYLSSFTNLNYKKIYEKTGGELEKTALSFCNDSSPSIRNQFLQDFISKFDSNLQSSRIRGILALDSAPFELLRNLNFINNHSEIDYRLVRIQRAKFDSVHELYFSDFPIFNEYIDPTGIRIYFKQLVNRFEIIKPSSFRTRVIQGGGKIRNLRIFWNEWPGTIHYEFSDWGDCVSIEIQVHQSTHPEIAKIISKIQHDLGKKLNNKDFAIDKDAGGYYRLKFFYSGSNPSLIAEAMNILIDESFYKIDKVYQSTIIVDRVDRINSNQ